MTTRLSAIRQFFFLRSEYHTESLRIRKKQSSHITRSYIAYQFKIFWIPFYLGILANCVVTQLSRTKQGVSGLSNSLQQRIDLGRELRPVSCPLRHPAYANTKKETYSDLSCAWNQGKRMGRRKIWPCLWPLCVVTKTRTNQKKPCTYKKGLNT